MESARAWTVPTVVSASLVEPLDPALAPWFATCRAASSPYARRALAEASDRRDVQLRIALCALAFRLRKLLRFRVWGLGF